MGFNTGYTPELGNNPERDINDRPTPPPAPPKTSSSYQQAGLTYEQAQKLISPIVSELEALRRTMEVIARQLSRGRQ